ncbi:MAG TPA: hypothetical protein VGG75_23120 [Trebonia sp.]
MAAKKRNSSKGSKRQGVSGNPQRRAEQLGQSPPQWRALPDRTAAARAAEASAAGFTPPPDEPLRRDAMRQAAYRMAGGADPAPWWAESHERVLARARTAAWPTRPGELEDLACDLVGGELHDCFQAYREGHHPAQWLVTLTQETGAALRRSLPAGPGGTETDDWRQYWSLLCGISRMAPRDPAGAPTGAALLASRMFPGIKNVYDTSLAEADKAATLLVSQGLAQGLARGLAQGGLTGPAQSTGAPLAARDAYGSRFLLAAPFRYADAGSGASADSEADHWYAWDIDVCWLDVVAGAGAFPSAEDALAEWRTAVGPRASGAELAACPPALASRLLETSLDTGPLANTPIGTESREVTLEYYRLRRRARELEIAQGIPAAPPVAERFMIDLDQVRDEFLAWHAARRPRSDNTRPDNTGDASTHGASTHGASIPGDSAALAEAVDTITDQWGPHHDIDQAAFYACSPHRIETTAFLIRRNPNGGNARPAIRLLPEWTQWCLERRGLSGEAAAAARGAAYSAVAALPDEKADDPAAARPFRRLE